MRASHIPTIESEGIDSAWPALLPVCRSHFLRIAGLILLTVLNVVAAPTPEAIRQLSDDFFALKPSTALRAGLSWDEAVAARRSYVQLLQTKLGPPVGFKVALTSKAAQEMAGAASPARGVLLEKMILPEGVEVPASYGARPIYEADFIAVVKDDGINEAKTPLEAARHLSELVAFIELADRMTAEGEKVDGNLVSAINAGARSGVLGRRVPIRATPEFVDSLGKMKVTVRDETGATLAEATGQALLGHPLNPVLWLLEDLRKTGERLKSGDLISLGSFARPQPPRPGQTITVDYEGLGQPLSISVHFKP